MTRLTLTLLAGLAAFGPVAAQAAAPQTSHATLVQEINNSYGTRFKVPGHDANVAALHNSPAHRHG